MEFQPSVALVILNWNTAAYLKRFIPALIAATYPNKEIYVIDNNSTDNSVELLQNNFPQVHVLRQEENKGFAAGYNSGLRQIDADYFLIINSDLEATPGFIEPLVALMENDKNIAACQSKLLSLNDKRTFEYAGAAGGWIDRLGLPFAKGRVFTTIEEDHGQYQQAEPIFWASGACMFLRASVFHKLGGFYEYYYMHQEDIDLCWRAQNSGYTIYSCPQSVVYHIGGGTLSWENHLKTFLTFRNNYIMLSRNLPFLHATGIVAFRMVVDFIGCFYFLVTGKAGISKAIIKAEFAFLYWLFFYTKTKNQQRKGFLAKHGIYDGTVLIPYFVNNKKVFSKIVK
ncbi:MAG: glycosyltransferase family 2 protein [Chitinophagaceae bacterium]|nr:glycosyltransferase family 2 protein [Chitinophagaceae bacterium]